MKLFASIKAWQIFVIAVFTIYLVVLVSVVVSLFGQVENRSLAIFDRDALQVSTLIHERVRQYELVLASARAYFEGSENVLPQEFHQYFETIDVLERFPEAHSFGYIKAMPIETANAFVSELQQDPFYSGRDLPELVNPTNKMLPVNYYVKMMEPIDELYRSIGYNHAGTVRVTAIEHARDSGQMALSDTMEFGFGDDRHSGFFVFVPVYDPSADVSTVESRRQHFRGVISLSFWLTDIESYFQKNISENNPISFQVFRGIEENESTLLFGSVGNREIGASNIGWRKEGVIPFFDIVLAVSLKGAHGYGLQAVEKYAPFVFFGLGLLLFLLLTVIIQILTTARDRAVRLANSMTGDLRKQQQTMVQTNKQLKDEVLERKKSERNLVNRTKELERMNKLMVDRELAMIALKEEIKSYRSKKRK